MSTKKNPKKPKEGKPSKAAALVPSTSSELTSKSIDTEGSPASILKPPIIPIPRRSYDDDKDVERTELVRRFGGGPDDWDLKDGYWVVKNGG